jgi:uncharacterized membrane protein
LLLPPAGGVFLLLFEHKSDYVRYVNEHWEGSVGIAGWFLRNRFHAWQSSMLFSAIFVRLPV